MLSIVMPFLDEEPALRRNLPGLAAEFAGREAVFVDGGSADGGAEVAAAHGRVIRAPRGRGSQLNAGARAARGGAFLFLHADCRLEPGALDAVEAALACGAIVGGWLTQAIDDPAPVFRVLETGANLRARLLRLPYGDQAVFVRREAFERIGGFPPGHPILEDLAFARRLRRLGPTAVVPKRVYASARRWRRTGVARATLRNWWIAAAYLAGVPAERLAASY